MNIRFFSKMVNDQLNFLLPRALVADGIIFIAMLPFYGLDIGVVLGLITGTAAMTANIALLGYSAERAVERGSARSAKRYMFSFYIIRFAIMGAAIAAGFLLPFLNPVCTYIPLLWPKVIYTLSGVREHFKK